MATAAELRHMRLRFAKLLVGECGGVAFTIAGRRITAGSFVVVGMSLAVAPGGLPHGPAAQRQMRVAVANQPGLVEARYFAQRNEIQVPSVDYGRTSFQEIAIVHESTHAVFDYERIRLGTYLEEAAAFIAGAMYAITTGRPLVGVGIFGVAEAIARTLIDGGGGAIAVVTPEQQQQIVGAIRTHPAYAPLAQLPPDTRYLHNGGRI